MSLWRRREGGLGPRRDGAALNLHNRICNAVDLVGKLAAKFLGWQSSAGKLNIMSWETKFRKFRRRHDLCDEHFSFPASSQKSWGFACRRLPHVGGGKELLQLALLVGKGQSTNSFPSPVTFF